MTLVDQSRVEIVLGKYGTAPSTALTDTSLLAKVQEHRRTLGARLVPLAREDVARRVPAGECHVSVKLDGEYAVLVVDAGEAILVNPGGTVRVGLPFGDEAVKRLAKAGMTRAMIAGELHVLRADGVRARPGDTGRVAGHPSSTDELATLCFAPFEQLEPPPPASVVDAWKALQDIFADAASLAPPPSANAKGPKEAGALFDKWVEKGGAEGIVVRSDAGGLFKVKRHHTLDVVVIGFTEGLAERKDLLHDVLVALVRDDGTLHVLGRVGGGFGEEDRRGFLADLREMVVASEYSEVNSDHVAYRMVRPEWVIEVGCLDLVAVTTRGQPIERMVLSWDAASAGYKVARRLPLASIIGPSFVRRRVDKAPTADHAGLRQVSAIVAVPDADRPVGTALPASEVLRREVATKVMKGQTMVRKLVLWKTNKERISSDHPAYVLHFTDYSPNRRDPLERELRVSSSREQMDVLFDELAKEAFAKGWTKA